MTDSEGRSAPPRVVVLADAEGAAPAIVERVLRPAGIPAWAEPDQAPPADILIVDITQSRGDSLGLLRSRRASGDEAPAIVLAARFAPDQLRDLFRLGVGDILMKPYRPVELVQAVLQLAESRSADANAKLLARRLEATRDQVRRRTEEIRLISEIGRTVVSLNDLDMILRRVVEAAAYLTDAEEANLYLADPESSEVVLRASKQAGDRAATLPRLRTTDSLAGEVYRTGEPILRQPAEGGPVKVQTGFLAQSLIQVPLRKHEEVVGVLGVFNPLTPRRFTDHHLTLMTSLAAWAGVALEHADLLRQAHAYDLEPIAEDEAPEGASDLEAELHRALVLLKPLLGSELSPVSPAKRAQLRALAEHLSEMRKRAEGVAVASRISLASLLGSITDAARPGARAQGADIALDVSQAEGVFPSDLDRVRRIAEALLSSALRRAGKGKITLEAQSFEVRQGMGEGISLPMGRHLADGRWVAVAVADSGPGLPSEALRALHTSAADPSLGPLGPGLSMGELRLIAESLGGALWHDSAAGTSRLVFALPAG